MLTGSSIKSEPEEAKTVSLWQYLVLKHQKENLCFPGWGFAWGSFNTVSPALQAKEGQQTPLQRALQNHNPRQYYSTVTQSGGKNAD